MNTKIVALTGMLALSLMTSVTFAQKPPAGTDALKYEPSLEQGVQPVWGVISTCDIGGVLAKNVNSGLSNANSAGDNTLTLDFNGFQLNLFIKWALDNTFQFYFVDDQGAPNDSGVVYEFGVKNNTDDIIYRYSVDGVSSDTELNDINEGVAGNIDADRANNVDICFAPSDVTPPDITFNSPLGDSQVSGTDYPVQVTVYDPSGVDGNSVTFNIDGDSFDMICEATDQSGTEYICRYSWNTEEYETGFYGLTATATDLFGNTGTAPEPPIEVEVVRQYTQCFGTIGPEDILDPSVESDPTNPRFTGFPGGCNPTGAVLIQTPPNGTDCATDPLQEKCYIAGTLLKPATPTDHCGIYGFEDPRMQGGSVPILGGPLHVFDAVPLDPSQVAGVVAAIRAAYPDQAPENDPGKPEYLSDADLLSAAVVLDENTFCANACCLIAQHTKGAPLDQIYQAWDTENGTAFIKVHKTREQFDKDGKAHVVTTCYDDSNLQKSFNAGYQPLLQTDDDTGVVTVLTQSCNSPSRTLSRGNGFDVSNIIVNTTTIADEPAKSVMWFEFRLQKIQEDFDRVFALFGIIGRDGYLIAGNFNRDVQNPVKEAQRKFQSNNIASKDQAIAALMEAADGIRTLTTYKITEANPPGEALAIIEHIIYELGVTRDEQAGTP